MVTIEVKPRWHHFEGKINWLGVWTPKKELNGELVIWRTKMQPKVQGTVELKGAQNTTS
jgi:hypothetical protein